MLVPVFMLDADLTAAAAREALAAVPRQLMLAVRRRAGEGTGPTRWYALSRFELDVMLAEQAPGQRLAAALDRYQHQPQPCAEPGDSALRAGRFTGIVVRGNTPLGYAAPAPPGVGTGGVTRGLGRGEGQQHPPPPGGVEPSVEMPRHPEPGDAHPPGAGSARAREVSVFPRVSVPAQVQPGQRFDVEIGLAEQRQDPTADEPMRLAVPARKRVVELSVQVVADGFEAPQGIRRALLLPREDLTSTTVRIPLVAPALVGPAFAAGGVAAGVDAVRAAADADAAGAAAAAAATGVAAGLDAAAQSWRGRVEVEYALGGTLVGRAWRDVVVEAAAPAHPPASTSGGGLPVVDPRSAPADLTVSVTEGVQPGHLLWTFVTPHPVALPDEQVVTDLPTGSARAFALTWVSQIAAADRTPAAPARLDGVARAVAAVTPVQFWRVLTSVWALAKAQGRLPTVLVVSCDPYLPWELLSTEPRWVVDRSLVDDGAPQLLGAQVQLGRWAPAGPDTPSGVRRPAAAPEAGIEVQRLAVVVGDYRSERGERPLPLALEEGRELTQTYPSVWVKGTLDEVTALLEGRLASDGMPAPAQVVHVACHGALDPQRPADSGIVLSDSALRIDELTVLGGELGDAGAPLVFLNACQLGQAQGELLGDQGGLAAAFLAVGCRGFLAPLWSVEDDLARDLALDFYRYTLGDGLTVGAALRRLRARFANIPGRTRTTPLAYAYYGHPDLRLTLTAGELGTATVGA